MKRADQTEVTKSDIAVTHINPDASTPEVTLSISMQEFLRKFFDMWTEDAAVLSGLLGFDSAVADKWHSFDGVPFTQDEMIQNRIDSVTLLKGADLPETLPASTHKIVVGLIKQLGDKLNTSEVSPQEDNVTCKGDSIVSQKDNKELSQVETLKAANVEALKVVETMKAQMKTMSDSIAADKKAKMVSVVKGYSFVTADNAALLVEFLTKSDDASVVLGALEAARDAIGSSVSIEKEAGAEGEEIQPEAKLTELQSIQKANDLTTAILAKRKENV